MYHRTPRVSTYVGAPLLSCSNLQADVGCRHIWREAAALSQVPAQPAECIQGHHTQPHEQQDASVQA